jgi:hypothetical protein
MTGGAHLSARHRGGRRRREVRRFPVREAAIRQGANDARSTGLRGRAGPAERPRPSGERGGGNGRLERKKMGRSWAEIPDGPAGRWVGWAESEEKIFFV